MNFFKILLATILGFFISLGVFFILFLIAISVMMSSVGASKGEEITVEDKVIFISRFYKKNRHEGGSALSCFIFRFRAQ